MRSGRRGRRPRAYPTPPPAIATLNQPTKSAPTPVEDVRFLRHLVTAVEVDRHDKSGELDLAAGLPSVVLVPTGTAAR